MTEARAATAQAESAENTRVEPEELRHLLRRIADAGGTIVPSTNPMAKNGYEFASLGPEQARLPLLAELGYLEGRFVDRVSLCPRCASHHLNLREACPTCRRSNLADEPLLHHFRCGYIGRLAEFETAEGQRICPKCARPLTHLGVEYDRLGKTFRCRDCGLSFQDPPVAALCLSCGAHGPAEDLPTIDILSYLITSQGLGAIGQEGGPLREGAGSPLIPGYGIYCEAMIREFLDQEAKRSAFFRRDLCILLIDVSEAAQPKLEERRILAEINALRARMREIDLVGRLAAKRFVAILPQVEHQEAERIRQSLASAVGSSLALTLSLVLVRGPHDLREIIRG
jgi:hypothetical protein